MTRLNKYLAQSGVASRRRADELIASGAVRINGTVVREFATLVCDDDRVEVNETAVRPPDDHTYLLFHKPLGVVTTMRDPQRRRTVADFLPSGTRAVPVGRLDYATTGVLLLTDDGELAYRLLHPKFGVEKTYRATIAGALSSEARRRLQCGLIAEDFHAAPARVRVLSTRHDRSIVELTIHEGRNRQVRRMFEALGHRVLTLVRTQFGPLRLSGLAAGQVRAVTAKERAALERHRRPPDELPRTKPNTKTAAK
ncbi:MAG: rRNA pseudouridine synthase [Candidatus Eremiobacteraeota bacterium]|nr:rRNA pseudouridine synthase [Candidatus Eremiobacteraeota bacterium]